MNWQKREKNTKEGLDKTATDFSLFPVLQTALMAVFPVMLHVYHLSLAVWTLDSRELQRNQLFLTTCLSKHVSSPIVSYSYRAR